MYVAKDKDGNEICARCGRKSLFLTKDHFIPKCCRMSVNEEGNYVAICTECNKNKADTIVLPSWYGYLNDVQRKNMDRYMRYARSWIRRHTEDREMLEYVERL